MGIILPDDIRPLGSLEQFSIDGDVAPVESLKFFPSDYAHEIVFFNHGALFTYAGFTEDMDPVADWYARQKEPIPLFKQAFGHDIFTGLDALTFGNSVPWNRILMGVARSAWHSLLEVLAGACMVNHYHDEFYTPYYGEVQLQDPGAVDAFGRTGLQVPQLSCVVFCVNGRRNRYEFVRPAAITKPPFVRTVPQDPLQTAAASRVLRDDLEPLIHRHNPAHAAFLEKYQHFLRHGPEVIETGE